MPLLPAPIRRRLKRRRFARTWRHMEAFTYQCAPYPTWQRIRRLNDLARVWQRRPERPRSK